MKRWAWGALCCLACVAPMTHCGSNEHPYDSGGVKCIDYPDAGYRVFPTAPADNAVFPQCTPSCHPQLAAAGAGDAPLDQDLPSGPCNDEGATCDSGLTAGWCPPCAGIGGPGNGYRCRCANKNWQCALIWQGGSICGPAFCLGVDAGCLSEQWTKMGTKLCVCGVCRNSCTSDADCASGVCLVNQVCLPPDSCPGPAECPANCTGLCQ